MNASKRSLWILIFVLFVVMLGWGIILPILPFYVERMGAGGTELGLLVASYAVMRLVFGPIWGVLSSATAPTTMAYIGDSTSEKERGGGMGMLGAASGLGTILGPALGGLLAGKSLATPFFIAAGMSVVSLLLGWVFLPESLPAARREKRSAENKVLDLRIWLQTLRSPVGILFILTFIGTCGLMVFANIFGLYALERFQYGPQDVGVMMMVLSF